MSTVWEVPVASPADWMLDAPRRLLRASPERLPRDARPSRARRARVSAELRTLGAGSTAAARRAI
ncbi:MAG: hypothetical protein KF727_09995 [Microbacteriaceae bacterium]|nr:hypothetical protein [Microbacteriaceae bacterium]